jgi:signal transduction histidine kinase
VLGESLQPVQDAVESLKKAMLIGLPPLALVLAILLWAVVGRTLRPVAAAIEREDQLIGDVSHELRSPLAGLRVLLETEPNDPQELELSRIEAIATLSRLETITEQLLVLTRHDHQRRPGGRHPVDLDEIVLHQRQALALRVPLRIDTTNVGPGQVLGNDDDLASLVDNLLENAARHARSDIAVSLREGAGTVELAVDDDGPGIDPADRDRIFERFTRLDEARSRDRGGAGLGLAIVQAIVDAYDGSIRVEDSSLGGARFVIQLPASTLGDPSDAKHEHTARDSTPPPDRVERPSAMLEEQERRRFA